MLQGPFGPKELRDASESAHDCSLPTRSPEELRKASGTSHYNSKEGGNDRNQRAFSLVALSHISSIFMRCICSASEVPRFRICDYSLAFYESRTVASRFSATAASLGGMQLWHYRPFL